MSPEEDPWRTKPPTHCVCTVTTQVRWNISKYFSLSLKKMFLMVWSLDSSHCALTVPLYTPRLYSWLQLLRLTTVRREESGLRSTRRTQTQHSATEWDNVLPGPGHSTSFSSCPLLLIVFAMVWRLRNEINWMRWGIVSQVTTGNSDGHTGGLSHGPPHCPHGEGRHRQRLLGRVWRVQ